MKTPEDLLKENVRDLISLVKKKNKNNLSEEHQLRQIIREFLQIELKEVSIPDNDPSPHSSTGINVLEDLLKRIVPILEDDYKLLTTSEEQRDSYRSHVVKATSDTLTPVELNNDAGQSGAEGLDEEVDVEISDDGDDEDDMFIDINPEDKEEVEEDPRDSFGIEGKDTTGRNMAYTTFKKIESPIIDAYDLLSNSEDQEIFYDYLIANLKLYFDKFESEIQPNVEEPSNQAYDSASEQPSGEEEISESIIDLEMQLTGYTLYVIILNMKKEKSSTKYKSIINKLLNNNKTNESTLTFIDSLSLEDLIALKLELSSRHINNKMYGLNIWSGTINIVREAILKFSVGATTSKVDAARFLGISYKDLLQLLKEYELWEYFKNERTF